MRVLAIKKTGTAAVNFLLSLFYERDELLKMNLEGKNGKEPVHPDILSAMISKFAYIFPASPFFLAMIKVVYFKLFRLLNLMLLFSV